MCNPPCHALPLRMVRLMAVEGSATTPLFVPASEDPLACLSDHQQQDPALGLADDYNPASLDILDHPLMLTDEVRSVLAVLAPWLAQQQPFLLVSGRLKHQRWLLAWW